MEEWDFVDDHDLQSWKGGVVCVTCQHFTYGVEQNCRACVRYCPDPGTAGIRAVPHALLPSVEGRLQNGADRTVAA